MELPVSDKATAAYIIQTKNVSYARQNSYHRDFTRLSSLCGNPRVSSSSPKYIVKNVNLEARPGQITAIAGPSGAGKTTLLEILAGKIPPGKFAGQVLVNGSPVNSAAFHRLSGYVTQDDALFPHLTVEETLVYSALLRQPPGEGSPARQRAWQLVRDLGLDHVAHSRIIGLSGGERRRVSVGAELVHDPGVLLVDEPTSGLDSSSALHIVSLLRTAAATRAKTIILTIHQPGSRLLDLIDNLVLISNGLVLHHGPLQLLEARLCLAGLDVPRHVNVLEFAIDSITSDFIDSLSHPHNLDEKNDDPPSSAHVISMGPTYSNSRLNEMIVLSDRFRKNIFRTRELFAARAAQATLVGSMLGTIYMNLGEKDHGKKIIQTRLGFFAFTLSFLLSSTTEALPIFLRERRVFERETSGGAYRISSYVAANALVFAPFLLLVALLYSAPVYWLVGLRRDLDGFLYFSIVAWAVILMSNSLTACFSALVPDFIMGSSVIAGMMGSFFLFSGYFIAREDIPRYWIFMHYLSIFSYPFESLVINEYGGKGGERCLEYVRGECVLLGKEYLRQEGLREWEKWSNLGVMFGFVVGYRVICFFILWYRACGVRK